MNWWNEYKKTHWALKIARFDQKSQDLLQNVSKNAACFYENSLIRLFSQYKMLPIFHFWISSENISTTKTKLPLNSIYNSGFWWILDFGELPPGNEKGSVITIIQFDVRNVLNVLNREFYDSTTSLHTLYEFYQEIPGVHVMQKGNGMFEST